MPTPKERDALAHYLRSGGWEVDAVGRRDLSARYRFGHDEMGERVNLRFSLALWRSLNRDEAPPFELA